MKKICCGLLLIQAMMTSALAQPWPKLALEKEMLIFPVQDKHVHGSSLVELPNGDLLAAWFYGSGERKEDDVRIMGARLKKNAKTWSAPFLMADTYHLPDCNPVLFLNSKGKLFLVWIAVQANQWEHAVLRFRTAVDYSGDGAPHWNWQDDILLKPDDRFAAEVSKKLKSLPSTNAGWSGYAPKYDNLIGEAATDAAKRSTGWMTRIHPCILKSGRIILPLYSDGFNLSLMAISDDDGDSWLPSLPVVGRGPIQPALALRRNGDIVAFMRDSGDGPTRVQESISRDSGESWTAAVKTGIPNTASVETCVLQDGRWLFAGNDIEDGRYRFSLYVSGDEGQTWPSKFSVESDTARKQSFSYPSLFQSRDGSLQLTYSYRDNQGKEAIKYVSWKPGSLH